MRPKALILVDIQNDFCPGGALAVPRGDEVVDVANRMQTHFDLVIATQDWHPANHLSFAVHHESKKPGDLIELAGLTQVLWPVHCVQNSQGAEFAPELSTDKITKVFKKGTNPELDSYSGFYDNDHRQSTGLTMYLRQRGITDVYILGLATDYCVKFTALDAVRDGFDTYLIEDGCRGIDLQPGDIDKSIAEMRRAGVTIISSGQIGP